MEQKNDCMKLQFDPNGSEMHTQMNGRLQSRMFCILNGKKMVDDSNEKKKQNYLVYSVNGL